LDRVLLAVRQRGKLLAFAKIAPHGSPELGTELAALLSLERLRLQTLRAPRPVAWFAWGGFDVLVLEPLSGDGPTNRPLGVFELAALEELAEITDALRPSLEGDGDVAVHGDFSGWNTCRRKATVAVWDWEWAHLGRPLEDLFHWETQRLIHFGIGDEETLLRRALEPSPADLERFLVLGADASAAPSALAAALQRSLDRMSTDQVGPERFVRLSLLHRLGSA
jgi:hypothetical protein